jgi:cell division transport system ATP-binding protein
VLVATHDSNMVDKMRRRVVELGGGRVLRDEDEGMYRQREQSTDEFTAMLRDENTRIPW